MGRVLSIFALAWLRLPEMHMTYREETVVGRHWAGTSCPRCSQHSLFFSRWAARGADLPVPGAISDHAAGSTVDPGSPVDQLGEIQGRTNPGLVFQPNQLPCPPPANGRPQTKPSTDPPSACSGAALYSALRSKVERHSRFVKANAHVRGIHSPLKSVRVDVE